MKKFTFRLEKVLELRLYKEKEIEMRLAAKEAECAALENLILSLMLKKRTSFEGRTRAGLDVDLLLSYEKFDRRMEREIDENQKILAQRTIERDEIQKDFLEAQKKRKILDRLKDRKYEAFRLEYNRHESKRVDDLNTSAYIRKTHG